MTIQPLPIRPGGSTPLGVRLHGLAAVGIPSVPVGWVRTMVGVQGKVSCRRRLDASGLGRNVTRGKGQA